MFVVDDNDDDIILLEEAISSIDNAFIQGIARNGMEALEKLDVLKQTRMTPSLMLVDINMPIINGFELLQRVRTILTLEELPIIIFSSSSRLEDTELAYKYGANAFLQKPERFDELEKTITAAEKFWNRRAR
nr:response regulator [Pelagicoccus albus]